MSQDRSWRRNIHSKRGIWIRCCRCADARGLYRQHLPIAEVASRGRARLKTYRERGSEAKFLKAEGFCDAAFASKKVPESRGFPNGRTASHETSCPSSSVFRFGHHRSRRREQFVPLPRPRDKARGRRGCDRRGNNCSTTSLCAAAAIRVGPEHQSQDRSRCIITKRRAETPSGLAPLNMGRL